MAATYSRNVYISVFQKGTSRIFECHGGWCWEATTVEGDYKKGGPFPTRYEARQDRKKFAEQMLEKQRSGDDNPKHGDVLIPKNWTVDYTGEGMVWFMGLRNPVPLDNVANVRPGVWKLINLASTSDEKK